MVRFKKVLQDRLFWGALCLAPLWLLIYPPIQNDTEVEVFRFVLLSGIVFPIVEELAFRGFLQTFLIRTLTGKKEVFPTLTVANIITSILFSLVHLPSGLLHSLQVFFPSLIFGWFKDKHGSVLPSVVLHVFYNCMYISFGSLMIQI